MLKLHNLFLIFFSVHVIAAFPPLRGNKGQGSASQYLPVPSGQTTFHLQTTQACLLLGPEGKRHGMGHPIIRTVCSLRSSGLESQSHERGQQTDQVGQKRRKFSLHPVCADFLDFIKSIITALNPDTKSYCTVRI